VDDPLYRRKRRARHREEDAPKPMTVAGDIYTTAAIRFENIHAIAAQAAHADLVRNVGTPLLEPPWPGGNVP
jgi:hypothetical protein